MPAKRIKLSDLDSAVKDAVTRVNKQKNPVLGKPIRVPIINGIIVDKVTLGGAKPVDIAKRIHKELPAGVQATVKPKVLDLLDGRHIVGLIPVDQFEFRQ